jgi:hypothetical protein
MAMQRNAQVYKLLVFEPLKNKHSIRVEYECRQSWSYHQGAYGYCGVYRKWCVKGEELESCEALEKFALGREAAFSSNLASARDFLD